MDVLDRCLGGILALPERGCARLGPGLQSELLVLTVLNIYWFKAIIAKVQRALAKRAPAAAMSAVSAVSAVQ